MIVRVQVNIKVILNYLKIKLLLTNLRQCLTRFIKNMFIARNLLHVTLITTLDLLKKIYYNVTTFINTPQYVLGREIFF